jgi:peptidoglycan/LPS O-acetylase OafA/YrhL
MSGVVQLRKQAGSATSTISREMSLILDIIRFSAAMLVLLHHAAFGKFGTFIPWHFTQTATEPVMAFFVLSGFVIALTAETNDRNGYQYFLSRAVRLLSVTIPAIILTVVLDHIGAMLFPALYADHWTDPATLKNLATPLSLQVGTTVTFLNQIWTLDIWPGTNSPFWSLGYEAAYYLIFGIAYYERRPGPRILGLALACLVIGPKVLLLFPIWLMGVGLWHIYKRANISVAGGVALCAFCAIGYAAFIATKAHSSLDHITEVLTAGAPCGLIGISNHFLSNYVSGLFFSGALIGLKGLSGVWSPILFASASWIRTLAHCTFSMYLYHYPLVYFFRAVGAVVTNQRDLNARTLPLTAIVVAGTGLSIYLLARLTEQKKNEFRVLFDFLFKGVQRLIPKRRRRRRYVSY